ncbi:hypothetical protein KAW65_00745 [candidate division WOR-3 bacterium]|nr:hypothetical protein [candidate division WOR-3 bacterium]
MYKLLCILCALCGLTHYGIASETRVATLGGVSSLLIDDSNVKLYPALITNYPDQITAELKNPALSFFIKFNDYGVFGIGINTDSIPKIVSQAIKHRPTGLTDFLFTQEPQLTLFYGKYIAPSLSLGLKLNYSNDYYKNPETPLSQSLKVWNSSIGVRAAPMENNFVDISAGISKFNFESSSESPGTGEPRAFKDQNKFSYHARARLLSPISQTTSLILGANFEKVDASWMHWSSDTTKENLTSELLEGYAGLNLAPSPNTTLILGISGGVAKGDTMPADTTDPELENIVRTFPKIIIAIESKLNNWLLLRLGATKSFNKIETKIIPQSELSEPQIIEFNESPFNLTFGWGIKINNFELDVMADELPFATPSLSLSATYKF